jgi:hypothetical protein
MLGKIYAPPTGLEALFFKTLWGFWVPKNLTVNKSRFETCLNGGSFLAFVNNSNHSNKSFLCCATSNEGNTGEENTSDKSASMENTGEGNISNENTSNENSSNENSSSENTSKGNTGEGNNNSTQNNPVPNRMAPVQAPGVYMILCRANNKRYFGQSANVSARLSQHRSRLRRNIHEIPELQRDFNLYGEDNFDFAVIWINRKATTNELRAMENEFVGRFYGVCYNSVNATNHRGKNNPFWQHTHTAETRQQMSNTQRLNRSLSLPDGCAIKLKGVVYPSISQAARETGHSRSTIKAWLNDPNNSNCVAIDVNKPSNTNVTANTDPLFANKGVAKKVSLYGVKYNSISEAARLKNCARKTILSLLRNDSEQCFIIED